MKQRRFFRFFLILICFVIFFTLAKFKTVQAQELPQDIAIAAIVEPWLYLEVSPFMIDLEPDLVAADGSFNVGISSDIFLKVGTSNSEGWYLKIQGRNNGLKSLSTDYTISSISGTSALAAGTDGYGANATSTLEGVFIGELYDYYGSDIVGELVNEYRVLASMASGHAISEVVKMQIKAAASIMAPADSDYADIIIVTITPTI